MDFTYLSLIEGQSYSYVRKTGLVFFPGRSCETSGISCKKFCEISITASQQFGGSLRHPLNNALTPEQGELKENHPSFKDVCGLITVTLLRTGR